MSRISHDFQRVAIREFRMAAGMTQKRFAHFVGLSPTEISKLENGDVQDPFFSTAAKLSDRLGVPLEVFAIPGAYERHAPAVRQRIRRRLAAAEAQRRKVLQAKVEEAERLVPDIRRELQRLDVLATQKGGVGVDVYRWSGDVALTKGKDSYRSYCSGSPNKILQLLRSYQTGMSRSAVLGRLRAVTWKVLSQLPA